eukprot:12498-Heterococcus_DN1.PRE.1
MQEVAAVVVQRVYRGHYARHEAAFLKHLHTLVISMQRRVRGARARRSYLRWLDMRTWAICEIQRVARGALARRLARARLRHFVDRGMRKVDAEVEVWKWRQRQAAARSIQKLWHRHCACTLYRLRCCILMLHRSTPRLCTAPVPYKIALQEAAEEALAAKSVEVAAEMAVVEYNRQKALAEYKQELTEWHERQKIEMAKSRLEDVSTKAERYKISTTAVAALILTVHSVTATVTIIVYRRRVVDRQRKEQQLEKEAKEARIEQERLELWDRTWAALREERAEQKKVYLQQPDTGAERSIRAELQKDIKAESLMVIKLADEQRIDLEWPEAIEIAKEQVRYRLLTRHMASCVG